MELTSPHNEYIKNVAALMTDAQVREAQKRYVIEGVVTVFSAIEAHIPLRGVVVSERYDGVLPLSERNYCVSEAVFKKISGTVSPQGILAVVDMPNVEMTAPKHCAVVLDAIRDPGNMGTILRTAAALGIEDVYCSNCVDPFNPKSVRASMTGIFFVRCHQADPVEIVHAVKSNCRLLVADMGGVDLFGKQLPKDLQSFALVVGNEAHGVSPYFRAQADCVVALPMKNVESLNAAVSASVILYHLSNINKEK